MDIMLKKWIGVELMSKENQTYIGSDKGYYRIRAVEVHATGLRLPSHMGITKDGQVLVSEFGGGSVRNVTEGGDYRDQSRHLHAWGMNNPGGVQPLSDGRILVPDSGTGDIYDITEPGSVTKNKLLFSGVPHPYGLVEFKSRLFTSFSNKEMVGISEIKQGEQFHLEKHAFVDGFPVVPTMEPYRDVQGCGGSWATAVKDDRLLLGHAALGTVFDVTHSEGQSFDKLRSNRFAWGLTSPLGMTIDPIEGNLYVCERTTGVIKRIAQSGGYSRFADPFLAGFQEPSCLRFAADGSTAYVCDRALGTVYRIELEHH
jgi:hypothetical protein